jgi:hypothetical protein
VCGVSECDREASIIRMPWHTRGCCTMKSIHTGREVASLKLLCVYLLGEIEGNHELKSPLLVYTVRVANSPPPVHMAGAFCNESLGLDLRSYDTVDSCFGQFNLSRVNAVENSPNCVRYSFRVTVVYPVVCSEIARRITNVVAGPLIVCPFCINIICIDHLLCFVIILH